LQVACLAAVPCLGHYQRDLLPQQAAQEAATALVQTQPAALGRQPPVGGFGRDPHQPGRHLLRAAPEALLAQPRPLLAPQGQSNSLNSSIRAAAAAGS